MWIYLLTGFNYLLAGFATLILFAGLAKSQGTLLTSTRDKILIPIFWWVYLIVWVVMLAHTGYKTLYRN